MCDPSECEAERQVKQKGQLQREIGQAVVAGVQEQGAGVCLLRACGSALASGSRGVDSVSPGGRGWTRTNAGVRSTRRKAVLGREGLKGRHCNNQEKEGSVNISKKIKSEINRGNQIGIMHNTLPLYWGLKPWPLQ